MNRTDVENDKETLGISDVISTLERQLEVKRQEVRAIEQAIALLSGEGVLVVDSNGRLPTAHDFAGLGIVDTASRFIKEMGSSTTTREIADTLLSRGIATRSKILSPRRIRRSTAPKLSSGAPLRVTERFRRMADRAWALFCHFYQRTIQWKTL